MTPTQALGWALVHSLWQGAFAATALAALFAIVPVRAARTRYALAVATLLLMVALPLGTALRLRAASSAPSWTGAGRAAASPVAPAPTEAPAPVAPTVPGTTAGATTPQTRPAPAPATPAAPARVVAARVRAALEPTLPWVVVVWLGGVLVLSLRLASGWMAVRRLGAEGTQPAPPACAAALARLAARLRISRPVRVVESAVVQVPAVIGWLRPVILLPASALTGLTPLQLDALLAHELAHVRRYDYVVNLLQSVIETLLFYHPAVWWVSRQVREEREHCCDDLAVAVCGDAHFYATALLSMERLRIATPTLVLAAGGGSLTGRIRRLLLPEQAEIFPHWIAGVAVALGLAMGGGAGLASARGATYAPGVQSTSGAAPADDSLTQALLARVRSLKDADARRDAVEEIGRSGDPRAEAALVAIARDDRDEHVQREAVVSLGRLNDRAGLRPITEIARTHPKRKVRHEAIEAIRDAAAPADALELLEEMALHDPERDVQQEAVEALGKLADARAFPLLVDFARHHPVPDMRREAVKALGKLEGPDSLPAVLEELAREGFDPEMQRDVVGALGDLRGPGVLERLLRLARTHPNPAVRRKAIDNYAEAVAPEAALKFLRDVLARDSAPEAQAEALEELAELPDDLGVPTLIDAAGMHPNRDVRAEAWRLLGRDARERAGLEQAPQRP